MERYSIFSKVSVAQVAIVAREMLRRSLEFLPSGTSAATLISGALCRNGASHLIAVAMIIITSFCCCKSIALLLNSRPKPPGAVEEVNSF